MTNLNKILILGLSALLVNIVAFTQNTQTILSEYWNGPTGQIEAPIFSTLVTKTDDLMNVYVAGATLDPNTNKLDLMIQKFNRSGSLLWQRTYGGALNEDDMAADVFIDDNYDVYVTGSVAETSQNFYDLVVIKYKSNGQFIWDYFYNYGGSPVPYDAGTAITGDNDGHIYVTGSSAGNNSGSDYVIIKLTSLNGNEVWTERYDYDGLDDIPAKIELNSANDKVTVSGGSQFNDNPVRWEMAMVVLDSANQAPLEELRTGESVSSGVSEVYDMTTDANDNIYIVGTKKNTTTDYDITVYKLDDELNLIWEETYDGYGEDDRGKGIKVDDQGNVYVVGYVTTLNEGKNYSLLKYDLNGNLEWAREYNGMASQDDEAIQLVITDDSKIVVTGSAVHGSTSDFVTLVYEENGSLINEISFNGAAGLNDIPTNMAIDLEGNIIVVGQTQTGGFNYDNVTVKYSVFSREKTVFSPTNGDAPYLKNNLILRFDKSKLNLDAIDNKGFVAGDLSAFVDSYFIVEMNGLTSFSWERIPTYKIHRRLTTSDSISISRQGDTIRMPDFWASLIVEIPKGFDEQLIADTLETIFGIHYAQLEYIYQTSDVPNDNFYLGGYQLGLYPNSTFPDADIDVEGAWEILDNAGVQKGGSHVKVGIYDNLIDWSHQEFGTSGLQASSKAGSGWNFHTESSNISDANTLTNSHGTKAAGIIGAFRNEGSGIAGIAGGDLSNDPNNDKGVQLFSMGIFYQGWITSTSLIAAAMVEGSSNTNTNFGNGLNLANHSYSTPGYPDQEVMRALKISWRNNTINVAARGNNGHIDNALEYPGCYINEKWLINVVASGEDGERKNGSNGDGTWASSYGVNANPPIPACYVDVMAPGTYSLVSTTRNSLDSSSPSTGCDVPSQWNNSYYTCFNGSSAAAAHVTGVAALMYTSHDPDFHWDYKNVLSTEDIEYILEKTTQKNPNQYDHTDGYGLVDEKKLYSK